MYMSRDISKDTTTDFFDMDYNRLDMRMRDPNSKVPPPKPQCFERMIELSKVLSKGIPHLRVDFYYATGQIYIGELTFFHCGGFVPIKPNEWNDLIGGWIELPPKNVIEH